MREIVALTCRQNDDPLASRTEVAMKLFLGFVIFFWLLCGLIGAWRLDDLDVDHWKTIARGPISLVHAFNEKPVTYPGPG
jgi:hypothetical protein